MARSLKYLDACIIIAAAKGTEELSDAALALIADPESDFVASRAVTLEAVAPPAAHGFDDQAEFAREFLAAVTEWVKLDDALFDEAVEAASNLQGLNGLDAVHAVAARKAGAEFITSERKRKAIHRVPRLRSTFLAPL